MPGAPHPARETLGPLDMRPIEAADIDAARAHFAGAIRHLKATEGQRAAVTAALAAIAAAADALVDLGSGEAALQALRMVAADLDGRRTPASESGETVH